ncbi:MAG: prephenate dehydrogenase/arogenate dehydrogenase family protein [Burkholderiaceae bacterium]
MIGTLAVIGLGLIGGSIAAATRASGAAARVIGHAVDDHGAQALRLGLIDEARDSVSAAVREADAVMLAVPVTAMAPVLAEVAGALPAHAWVSDCCSTKVSAVAAARRALSDAQWARYVPGHPIAGSEMSGPPAARAELFRDKAWLLSPVQPDQFLQAQSVQALVECFGARVSQVEPGLHDAMFAEYSHMPHALVFALCHAVANGPHAARLSELAGAGFKDTSRIGASAPPLWTDILIDNREQVLASMRRLQGSIDLICETIGAADRDALLKMIERASQWRGAL